MNGLDFLASYFTLASEFFMIQYILLFTIITLDPYGGVLLAACYVKIIINKMMKYYANLYCSPEISDRPFEATSTNILDSNLLSVVESRPGFPSGHTMAMSFFTTLACFRFKQCPFIWILFVITLGTGWSRYYKKAHTLLQVQVGYLVGIIYGLCVEYFTRFLPYSDQYFWNHLLTLPNTEGHRITSVL